MRKPWTTPQDITQRIEREWNRGVLLASLVANENVYSRRIPLKSPNTSELATRFEEARAWIKNFQAAANERHGFRLEWREIQHPQLGRNSLPAAACVDSLDNALALIGKRRQAERFTDMIEVTRRTCPVLLSWLAKRPLTALDYYDDWTLCLDLVNWLIAHPRPDIYLRQIDLPGIHSKFIEQRRGLLAELFDIALPAQAINPTFVGAYQFEPRYGFKSKPSLIRLRYLDRKLTPLSEMTDITLTSDKFAQLNPPVSRIFITENEINFLTLPDINNSLALFGAGYGFEALKNAKWLAPCAIYYWGDIDTHGFAILNQLRQFFPNTQSFLMDRQTLMEHRNCWGTEGTPTNKNLLNLTPEEMTLYDDLIQNRFAPNLRLEQEKISYQWIKAAFEKLPTF